jgi:Predicted membrane protein/domain
MENNIYSAPESDLNEKKEYEEIIASRWSRLGAAILDALITIPFSIAVMYFTGGFEYIQQGVEPPSAYTFAMGVAGVLFFIAIHGYLLVSHGQTVGKKLVGIKIVAAGGEALEKVMLIKRYVLYMGLGLVPVVGSFLSIINVLFIFSSSKRCLHDRFANTRVVRVES